MPAMTYSIEKGLREPSFESLCGINSLHSAIVVYPTNACIVCFAMMLSAIRKADKQRFFVQPFLLENARRFDAISVAWNTSIPLFERYSFHSTRNASQEFTSDT